MSWEVAWPGYEDVSITLHKTYLAGLSPEAFAAYTKMAWMIAISSVNNRYSGNEPECSISNEDDYLARICFVSKRKWRRIKAEIIDYFIVRGDRPYLKDDDVVRISKRAVRTPVPMAVKSAAMARAGKRCAYCGDEEGPFHYDHLFPVSKGGTDDPHNIVVACTSCNLSKGDKTVTEWVAFLLGRNG